MRKMNTAIARPMRPWMKILFSLLLLSFSAYSTCHFKERKVYSLSGPATKIIEEMGLLHQLKGISVFYPAIKNFKGEIIPGGIFLSPSKLLEMEDSVVFFDQSQELRKTFARKRMKAIEVNGRNKSPAEVVTTTRDLLAPYIEGCDFGPVLEKTEELEKKITVRMKEKMKVIFFLGEVGNGKLPELVIANDGIALWLKKKSLIDGYPSELAYVNWSGSLLESLKKDHLLLGLKEGSEPKITGDHSRSTLTYPGILIPGLHQLEAWLWYLEHQGRN